MALTAVFCLALAACGGGGGGGGSESGPGQPAAHADVPAAQAAESTAGPAAGAPSSRMTITGVVNRTVELNTAVSGIEYGRYQINLAADAQPVVLLDLGRADTSALAPGVYPMGAGGFDGTVEIYGDPMREFSITAGELEIVRAQGDTLTGRFSFIAHELGPGGRERGGEVQVDGTFRTTGRN